MKLLLATVLLLVTACGRVIDGQPVSAAGDDGSLVAGYFERSNAAAREGPEAQRQFLVSTQHPDFRYRCDLGNLVVELEPALSSMHIDASWEADDDGHVPRGRIYAVAVTVTVTRDKTTLGTQVGSMHVVILDGAAFGFAPCPT